MNFIKKNNSKIFCIGNNKTGTTSLEKFFEDHDYNVAPQRDTELLLDAYIKRDWKPILQYVKKYEVFQDIPFSNEYLYVLLHNSYPNSKFILSVRDNSEQWYNSITKFHGKLFGKDGRIPTKEDLQNGTYIEKGWIWKSFSEKFGDFDDPYNKERLIDCYEKQNANIRNYFKDNVNFIEINISNKDAIQQLSSFLKITSKYLKFPHENKTTS